MSKIKMTKSKAEIYKKSILELKIFSLFSTTAENIVKKKKKERN